jgi:hypothetical protein
MNLNDLLRAEPNDAGCDASARYFEPLAEATVSGLRTEVLFPHTTAHLRACGACREDLAGLIDAITSFGDATPP